MKDASTIAKTIVEKFKLKNEHFKSLKSDNNMEFKNELYQNIWNILGIELRLSAVYHHESWGSNERNHRGLNELLLGMATEVDLCLISEATWMKFH